MRRPRKSGKVFGLGVVAVLAVAFWWSSAIFSSRWLLSYDSAATVKSAIVDDRAASSTIIVPLTIHQPKPETVKALYMTQCAATSPILNEHLLKLADETEINSMVVDVKDYSGTVIFAANSKTAIIGGNGCTHQDFGNLIKILHEHNLYVIGRLTVFQDPLYTKTYPDQAVQSLAAGKARAPAPWRDRKGLSFVDVASRLFWDYIIALAREAYDLGVDEINFDYVRYPSDGNMADAGYLSTGKSKAENLELFFQYLNENLDFTKSVDLFGMTATNYDDLNIGQVLERALPYFDYVAPMVYPSHYPPTFNGWANPNEHPYDIVYFSLSRAVARAVATTTSIASLAYEQAGTTTPTIYIKPAYDKNKIRPWLQDFDYPVTYTAEMVKAQIQATYDVGLDSWMLWDPANRYTPSALQP
jgi:hypothetical protein